MRLRAKLESQAIMLAEVRSLVSPPYAYSVFGVAKKIWHSCKAAYLHQRLVIASKSSMRADVPITLMSLSVHTTALRKVGPSIICPLSNKGTKILQNWLLIVCLHRQIIDIGLNAQLSQHEAFSIATQAALSDLLIELGLWSLQAQQAERALHQKHQVLIDAELFKLKELRRQLETPAMAQMLKYYNRPPPPRFNLANLPERYQH